MDTTGFSDLPLSPSLLAVVAELGFVTPTPIQRQAVAPLVEGRDLVGQAATGSGKTLAFCLPLLQRLQPDRQVQALVLCPTRELCAQLAREVRTLGRGMPDLRVLELTGGRPIRDQIRALATGAHVVVGTPGRTKDLLERGALDPATLAIVVLDEADRMLDMGFLPDIGEILAQTPPSRQTVLFSATLPPEILALSRSMQRDPVAIHLDAAPVAAIHQEAWLLPPDLDRLHALDRLLVLHRPVSALVFCNQRDTVEAVATALRQAGHAAAALHGGLEQRDRDAIMAQLRNRSVTVVVATDVAARGLDVDALDLVVNHDLPQDADTYLHRIGRTGRAGQVGRAATLCPQARAGALNGLTDGIERRDPAELPTKGAPEPAPTTTLRIGGGRRDKLRKGDVLGALTGEAGDLDGAQVGRIEIGDRVTFVAVDREVASLALARLARGRIKGRRFRVERL